jgi:nidogen (entactin)
LTFLNEFPEFLNIPFPIEYPSISPFYSNIDISQADGSSKISYYQSTDGGVLNRAASNIRNAFSSAQNFRAKSILVVTWNNVPKWKGQSRERSYEKNTFQVAVISNDEESFVEFLYPQSGLQWVQAETGESGLPDIRARAGFIAADGRFVALKGSGSDKVRHLSETSNFGQPGRWLYRVGKLRKYTGTR